MLISMCWGLGGTCIMLGQSGVIKMLKVSYTAALRPLVDSSGPWRCISPPLNGSSSDVTSANLLNSCFLSVSPDVGALLLSKRVRACRQCFCFETADSWQMWADKQEAVWTCCCRTTVTNYSCYRVSLLNNWEINADYYTNEGINRTAGNAEAPLIRPQGGSKDHFHFCLTLKSQQLSAFLKHDLDSQQKLFHSKKAGCHEEKGLWLCLGRERWTSPVII